MKNKNGVSTVIATVLLVLMTLILAFAVAQFVIPFVKNGLNKSTECINYEGYFTFDESLKKNCYDLSEEQILFSIRAKNDKTLSEEIAGFKVVFIGNGISRVLEINGSQISTITMLDGSSDLNTPESGNTYTYAYTTNERYDYAEVYPLLKNQRLCERAPDKIKLVECGSK